MISNNIFLVNIWNILTNCDVFAISGVQQQDEREWLKLNWFSNWKTCSCLLLFLLLANNRNKNKNSDNCLINILIVRFLLFDVTFYLPPRNLARIIEITDFIQKTRFHLWYLFILQKHIANDKTSGGNEKRGWKRKKWRNTLMKNHK